MLTAWATKKLGGTALATQLPPVVTKDEKGIPIMAVADLLEVLER